MNDLPGEEIGLNPDKDLFYRAESENVLDCPDTDAANQLGEFSTIVIAGMLQSALDANQNNNSDSTPKLEVFQVPSKLENSFKVKPRYLRINKEISCSRDIFIGYRDQDNNFVIVSLIEVKHSKSTTNDFERVRRNYKFAGPYNISRFTISFTRVFELLGYNNEGSSTVDSKLSNLIGFLNTNFNNILDGKFNKNLIEQLLYQIINDGILVTKWGSVPTGHLQNILKYKNDPKKPNRYIDKIIYHLNLLTFKLGIHEELLQKAKVLGIWPI